MRLGYKYIFAVVILLCTFTGMMLAQNNLYNIEVQAFDGYVRISWKIDSESGIDHYEIWRSSGSSIPIIIGKVDAGISYFDDKNVGFSKTEDQFFIYQVKAIGSNSSVQGKSETMGVRYSPTSSTYKRTWGSIKAMFR